MTEGGGIPNVRKRGEVQMGKTRKVVWKGKCMK